MRLAIISIFILLMLPYISADLVTPGFKYVPLNNVVSNIDDYPNYYFFTVCSEAINGIVLMEDSNIGSCYKFSKLSVYVIEKENFNINDLDSLVKEIKNSVEPEYDIEQILEHKGFMKVLDDIPHSSYKPITSTVKSTTNYFDVNLGEVISEPVQVEVKRNSLFYIYMALPLIALLIILIIILKRR